MILSADEIAALLPHQPPLRLVDGVSELSKERIIAHRQLDDRDPIFAAHFPGFAVMPGVLIVEAMAQAAAILAAHCKDYDPATETLLLMTIEEAKFRAPARPPELLELLVEPSRKGKLWRCRGEAHVGTATVAQAIFTAAIRPWDRIC